MDAPATLSIAPRGRWVAALFALSPLLSIASGALAFSLFAMRGTEIWYVSLATALTAVAHLLLVRVAKHAAPDRALRVTALALLAQLPLPWLGTALDLGQPLVSSHWRCGTGDLAFMLFSPIAAAFTATLAGLVTWLLVARSAGSAGAFTKLRAGAVIALSVAVFALGLSRAAGRPSPDEALRQLPVHVTLAPVPEGTPAPQMDAVGRDLLWRTCHGDDCSLGLTPAPFVARTESGRSGHANTALDVWSDPALHLLVVATADAHRWIIAFDTRERRAVDVLKRTMAPRSATPLPTLLAAGFGLLLALGVIARRSDRERALSIWRGAREATATADGSLRFTDSTLATWQRDGSETYTGPVLVRAEGSATPFREAVSVRSNDVLTGSAEALARALDVARADRLALAAAVALFSVVPLSTWLVAAFR